MNPTHAQQIGSNLAQLRRARRLTQQALADRCSALSDDFYTVRTISRWERGESEIPASRLCTLASALEVTIDRICCCIPSDAIDSASVISETLARLSPDRRMEIDYIFRRWDGDVPTLITVMCAYASMPTDYRADCAFLLLHQFSRARAASALDPAAPLADISSICAAWERIVTRTSIK